MNLRSLIKYLLWRDTTFRGEYAAIRDALPDDAPRTVVDVGANDGIYGSNSYPFIARGWRAVLIEPDPRPFARLQKRFAGQERVACLNLACADQPGDLPLRLGRDASHSSLASDFDPAHHGARSGETVMVKVERLADVLFRLGISRRFGVLSIDTEGMDLEVLRGLDLAQWRPDVIFTENFAPKEEAKAQLLRQHGYALCASVDTNTLWTAAGRICE
jgi:FkbM family methyltransferase